MKRITSRFVLLIATAAVAPLVLYGAASVTSLRNGTRESVTDGNLKVATQVAAEIDLYMRDNVRVLQSLGAELTATDLYAWQQNRILKDHVLAFPEFRELTLFDASGHALATSALGASRLPRPSVSPAGAVIAPVRVDDDLLPTTTIAIPLKSAGGGQWWIEGEIALEQLWRTVDSIHVGNEGYAAIISEDGRLIAHGNPDEKREVAREDQNRDNREVIYANQFRAGHSQASTTYLDEDGRTQVLAVAAPVKQTGWTVVVEQPTAEAYAIASRLERQLIAVIAIALLVTIIVGYVWGRSFIRRIFALTRVTRSIAEGKLETRVALSGQDEIRELGDAFNSMADRLVELQENVRKQERQAMFGRIAAGLVHDLSHPIQNIGNSCKLIVKMADDAEYRETFRRTVDREMVIVKRVLEDLRNIAKPIPLERFPVDINKTVADAVEAMQPHAETAGLTLRAEFATEPLFIEGDVFALGRVYRNLILNAIQATAPGGLVVAATGLQETRVQIRVYDTGCGIPADRLHAVFEDFVTTKRRGLGLGLAISKKIVEQLGGTITVASEVGKGTTFVMEFPRTEARPAALIAG
ncbi:MAG TPA: sensor histidine kinase [Vicinamibacterales bacterium]|jgi:signal transduction histidine kinase|nr:sensor histidine kinase [Vicinamibacterales bacterium]